jgi:putative ABC transport system permease protein
MLALANIRKTKMQTVTLVLLFVISSMLMNIGLMVSLNFGSFYNKTADELNTNDAYFIIPETIYNEEIENFIISHEETVSFAKNTGVITNPKLFNNDSRWIIFFDKNETRSVSEWKFVSETLPETVKSIYLPYQFKASYGYELGETIIINFDGKTLNFIISGFTEDILFSSYDMAVLSFYLPSEGYAELTETLSNYRATVVFTDVRNSYKSIESGLTELTGASLMGAGDTRNMIITISYNAVRHNRCFWQYYWYYARIPFAAVDWRRICVANGFALESRL